MRSGMCVQPGVASADPDEAGPGEGLRVAGRHGLANSTRAELPPRVLPVPIGYLSSQASSNRQPL